MLVITLAGVLAVVFAFVVSNVAVNDQPDPHGPAVVTVGSQQTAGALAGRLDRIAPGGYAASAYSSPALARRRRVLRALRGRLGRRPPVRACDRAPRRRLAGAARPPRHRCRA